MKEGPAFLGGDLREAQLCPNAVLLEYMRFI